MPFKGPVARKEKQNKKRQSPKEHYIQSRACPEPPLWKERKGGHVKKSMGSEKNTPRRGQNGEIWNIGEKGKTQKTSMQTDDEKVRTAKKDGLTSNEKNRGGGSKNGDRLERGRTHRHNGETATEERVGNETGEEPGGGERFDVGGGVRGGGGERI